MHDFARSLPLELADMGEVWDCEVGYESSAGLMTGFRGCVHLLPGFLIPTPSEIFHSERKWGKEGFEEFIEQCGCMTAGDCWVRHCVHN